MDIFVIDIAKANFVPYELLQNFGQKKFKDKRQELVHKFSYLMLDRILKEVYRIENRSILFGNGRPFLATNEKYFSISHSGEYIIIGFSDNRCGIDIEKIKPRDYAKISKRMGFTSSSLEEFYINWTKYEAQYKLDGNAASLYNFKMSDYIITAVSENKAEQYEIYYNQ